MKLTTGYQAIAQAVKAIGVSTLYGVMGDGNMQFISSFVHDQGGRYVSARHEAGAVTMADGAARALGGRTLTVATVTHGPGLTNAVTAITAAARNRTPLLLVAGDLPRAATRHNQRIDQAAVVAPTGAAYVRATTAASAGAQVLSAMRQALLERRPVVLDVANDVQREEWPGSIDVTGLRTMLHAVSAQRPRPDDGAVGRAARMLADAARPVILAGRGAVWSDAGEPLRELAHRSGALLSTTLLAKGLFDGDPFDLGVAGAFGTRLARDVLAESDLVLAVGASLHAWTTSMGTLFPHAEIVQVDVSGELIGDFTAVDHVVLGDAAITAQTLSAALPERRDDGFRTPAVRRAIASFDPLDVEVAGSQDRVDPRLALAALDRLLPPERIVLSDGGHYWNYPSLHLGVPAPGDYILAANFGALGLGLGTAIGAAVARPDRTAVLVIGDGGLMMSLPELESAVRLALPMVVIVINDAAYGSEVHSLRGQGLPPDTARFPDTDFVKLAEGIGATGACIRSLEDIPAIGTLLAGLEGPLVIDMKVDPELVADWFRAAKPPTAKPPARH